MNIVLNWNKFDKFRVAHNEFAEKPCLYAVADGERTVLRIGQTSVGLDSRYHGGDVGMIGAVMDGSKNLIFVASAEDFKEQLVNVERELISKHKPRYNIQGKDGAPSDLQIRHEGDVPNFT